MSNESTLIDQTLTIDTFEDRSFIIEALNGQTVTNDTSQALYKYLPLIEPVNKQVLGVLRLRYDLAHFNAQNNTTLLMNLIGILSSIVLTVILVFYIVRKSFLPISEITDILLKMSQNDLTDYQLGQKRYFNNSDESGKLARTDKSVGTQCFN